tara:strand:- start:3912 stop:4667 length:756 start_codon:yes stop_codon:yes gene_type:complete
LKKIIWIDIGTHFGQEHSSIFYSNYSFYSRIIRRFLGAKVLKRGKFVSFNGLKNIIHARSKIRKRSKEFYTVFVEANPKIAYKKNFYPATDMFFNLALTSDSHTPVSIAKLYIGDGGELAEGNSLFSEKHNSHNGRHIATFGVSASNFFSALRSYLNEKFGDYDVLLRINCEGVEDDAIYSAYSSFGNKLKLICGSLKDVEELKGLEASQKLDTFISDNKLLFVKFSSGIYSWPKAHAAVLNMLEKKDERL